MARVRPKQRKSPILKFAIIGIAVAIAGVVAYSSIGHVSVPGAGAKNFSFKIAKTENGVAFVSAGSGGKKMIAQGHNSPTLEVNIGDTVTIHVINEDTGEKHDFTIPDLNVHSKLISYFEADTVTFVPDKQGEFVYTSSTHPEIKGMLIVK